MKYVAFVQRDQVSGQTKKHCLSSVHLGKGPKGAGPFVNGSTIPHTEAALPTWREFLL